MLLKFAYEDFIADRKFNNTTGANIENYNRLLKPFINHCINNGLLNVEEVSYSHFREYLMECQQRGNKPTTINSIILRVRAFYNYLLEEKIVKESIAKKVKLQKTDVKIEVFTDEQIYQMLAYYRTLRNRDKTYLSYRGYILILLLLGTGIRRKELIMLKWSDVNFNNSTMNVYGKNRNYETVFLTDKLLKELSVYKTFCTQYFKEEMEYVIVNRRNEQMTIASIASLFRNLQSKMNFKDVRVSAHTFRHTFCHRLAMSGMNAFSIQKLMRHTDVSTTMRYVAMWGNELKEQNQKHSPLNNLDI